MKTTKQRYYESYSHARTLNKTRGLNEQTKKECLTMAVEAFKNRFKKDNLPSLEFLLTRALR